MGDFPRRVFDRYQLTDYDDTSDPIYLGFLDKDGGWYIKEINEANGTVRFDKGTSDYSTNWTGRTSLTYNYFDVEF